eukprot:7802830-Pyramimonas_sp.AAC.1
MASNMARDTPRRFMVAPNLFQEAPSPPKDGSKRSSGFPRRSQRGPTPPPTKRLLMRFAVLACSFPTAIRGLKMAPLWPKKADAP